MKPQTRRAIAYIVGRIITAQNKSAVYDYSSSQYHSFSGSVSLERVSIYDYSENCHISGNLPNLYHYGNSSHISLKINSNKFSGYDYDDSAHFSGNVNGNGISLYDYGESSYYNFSI